MKNTKLYNTVITNAQFVQSGSLGAGKNAALTGTSAMIAKMQYKPHCLVQGEIEPRTGIDKKHYGTKFELRLPQQWNKKFLFQGGGGLDGVVNAAVGGIPYHQSTATPALWRGYAVVSTDSGHEGSNADFGADQQARVDYAYAAFGKVTVVAKQLIEALYQAKPEHSVFMGCSNGGREALIATQRYPTEFDGVIAGNPGFRLAYAAVGEAWDNQHFMQAAPTNNKGEKIFANALTQSDLDAVVNGVVKQCDAKDGLADGIVNAWESCDFKPEMVENEIGKDKVALLNAVFKGAKNSRGENVYASWPYDAGLASDAWRSWKLGTSQTATPNANNIVLGASALPLYYMTPRDVNFDTMKFNFDTDVAKIAQMSAITDAVATDLGTFASRGGKLIIVDGVSDPVFSAHDIRDYYKEILANAKAQGHDATQYSRLFMVPGMNHCGDGVAMNNFDPLTALEEWTDKGKAPDYMLATGPSFPNKSQPICAYPKVATYVGGNKNKATSFKCK
ncbi:feruloyl esterase [Neisseria perflava]|uniref:tannase/feruloyl esterase family alpha/beta hydrolase n=1 Tax=Neisseria perflava TaxID=33053 RepID=UPI00209CF680|nr:tannase/feruloyl esterase family alpha/beta hydrolase [Neisseria perflava]MCP1772412.1 feruloyl esterase [Neisseria perflava]